MTRSKYLIWLNAWRNWYGYQGRVKVKVFGRNLLNGPQETQAKKMVGRHDRTNIVITLLRLIGEEKENTKMQLKTANHLIGHSMVRLEKVHIILTDTNNPQVADTIAGLIIDLQDVIHQINQIREEEGDCSE